MRKIYLIVLTFLICSFNATYSQNSGIYTATQIDQVETIFYSPYWSELRQIKARLDIQGQDSIARKNYTFAIYFYENEDAKGTNSVRDAGNRIIIQLYYPMDDFYYYDNILNNVDRSQLALTYEYSDAASVDALRIKRTN